MSKYKSEFLANMSHEMRTPLNSMMILRGPARRERGQEPHAASRSSGRETIHSAGRDLLALINQILDLSKIEAGRMEIERRRVPLGEIRVLRRAELPSRSRQQKNLKFDISIAPEAPPTVTTDPQRLQQILKNLLSNAFKFTETGSVEMRIAVERDTQRFQSHAFGARRQPWRLPSRTRGSAFRPRSSRSSSRRSSRRMPRRAASTAGPGSGLTISRELARLLGGEIHLKSAPGVGSTFTLYLPITRDDHSAIRCPARPRAGGYEKAHTIDPEPTAKAIAEAPSPGQARRLEEPALAGKKVLVVDDDVRNLFAMTSLLEKRGMEVLPAGSAKEAFELAGPAPRRRRRAHGHDDARDGRVRGDALPAP